MRGVLQRLAWPCTALGLLVMVAAGVRAGRWQKEWLEPQPACVRRGECSLDEVEPALQALWWVLGAGGLLVVIGLALVTWGLGAERRRHAGGTPVAHVLASVLVTAFLGVALLPLGLGAIFLSPHAFVAVLTALVVAEAALLVGVDRYYGAPHVPLRRAWFVALGAGFLGLLAMAVSIRAGGGPSFWLLPLAGALTVGAVIAVARVVAEGPAGRGVVAVLLVLSGVAVLAGVQALPGPAWPEAAHVLAPHAPERPEPIPQPDPAPLPPPPEAPPTPPPVAEAAVPCAPEDLTFAVLGFDGAMGARAASLQATNVSATPCWVEGVPVVLVMQGERPLALTVGPGQTPDGGPAVVQRVDVAPGGSALSLMTWRSYGGWADTETPQSVVAALDATSTLVPVALPEEAGPAPFDIADGGAWAIAPWAPAGG
ncbi:UNVERIFIED_ORG: DUF4232 domain-containing protein [Bacillus sp. AZ43]